MNATGQVEPSFEGSARLHPRFPLPGLVETSGRIQAWTLSPLESGWSIHSCVARPPGRDRGWCDKLSARSDQLLGRLSRPRRRTPLSRADSRGAPPRLGRSCIRLSRVGEFERGAPYVEDRDGLARGRVDLEHLGRTQRRFVGRQAPLRRRQPRQIWSMVVWTDALRVSSPCSRRGRVCGVTSTPAGSCH